jgi:hypothetical protein
MRNATASESGTRRVGVGDQLRASCGGRKARANDEGLRPAAELDRTSAVLDDNGAAVDIEIDEDKLAALRHRQWDSVALRRVKHGQGRVVESTQDEQARLRWYRDSR